MRVTSLLTISALCLAGCSSAPPERGWATRETVYLPIDPPADVLTALSEAATKGDYRLVEWTGGGATDLFRFEATIDGERHIYDITVSPNAGQERVVVCVNRVVPVSP